MVIGLVCAVAAAVSYALGSILQSVAADRAEKSESALDPASLLRVVRQLPYVLGLGFDGVGFLVSLIALSFLPLFLSEALIASSVAWTALFAAVFLRVQLRRVEVGSLIGLVTGLVLLALSASDSGSGASPPTLEWVLLIGVAGVGAASVVAARLPHRWQGVGLAVVSGLAYSGMGIAARSLADVGFGVELLQHLSTYALLLYGGLGLALFALALQRERVTTVTALVFGIETVLPAVVGILVLGDMTRDGMGVAALLGFVLAVGCTSVLAANSTPHTQQPSPPAL